MRIDFSLPILSYMFTLKNRITNIANFTKNPKA